MDENPYQSPKSEPSNNETPDTEPQERRSRNPLDPPWLYVLSIIGIGGSVSWWNARTSSAGGFGWIDPVIGGAIAVLVKMIIYGILYARFRRSTKRDLQRCGGSTNQFVAPGSAGGLPYRQTVP